MRHDGVEESSEALDPYQANNCLSDTQCLNVIVPRP